MVKETDMRDVYPSDEQLKYADLLFYGCWFGLLLMLVTYLLYVTGIVPAYVPLHEMPQYWSKPVTFYLEQAKAPQGWGWAKLLGRGDYMNFIGVALLAGMSVFCYLRILPDLIRKRDKLAVIAVLEVLVLLLAASGLVGAGGH